MGELKYLAGLPISFFDETDINNPILICKVYPRKLREIAEIDEEKYNKYLNILTFTKEDIKRIKGEEEQKDEDNEEITLTPFEILVLNLIFSDKEIQFEKTVLDAIEFFTKERPIFDKRGFFYFGKLEEERLIHKENFNNFIHIVKKQNCLLTKEEKENEFNPVNDKAKEIIEKMKKNRKKIAEKKAKEKEREEGGEPLTLYDLISILASQEGNNLNILNIWDLTMVAFNDQFNRMKMIEEYNINVQALLHGASSKDIELKHYMRKLE